MNKQIDIRLIFDYICHSLKYYEKMNLDNLKEVRK